MAQDSGQDRTEEATPRRILQARQKGDVPRSRELNTVLMLAASLIGFAFLGKTGVNAYKRLAKTQWQIAREDAFNDLAVLNSLLVTMTEALWIAIPFMAMMFLAVFIGPMCMGGLIFSIKSLKVDFKKLSPLAGLKRMVGVQSLMELLKAILKIVLLGGVAVLLLKSYVDDYLQLGVLPIRDAVNTMFSMIFVILLTLVITMGLIAVIDVPYQRWSYAKKLRMTLQEVRDENKEQQGNPQVKSKVRQMQQAMASKRMLADVPTADVVIVNPTHYSVALKYEEDSVAPVVVAMGVDHLALKIREVARESDVMIFRAPPLARALYRHAEVGETIPAELYLAVAQVLAYVMQVKQLSFPDRRRLVPPSDLSIPDSLQDPEDTAS